MAPQLAPYQQNKILVNRQDDNTPADSEAAGFASGAAGFASGAARFASGAADLLP
jgi:hypothetical protein